MGVVKQKEQVIQTENYEKVIMMVALEIRNLHEGKEPKLSCGKEKSPRETHEKLTNVEDKREILPEKLEKTGKTIEEGIESRNTLMKVVESDNNVKKPGLNINLKKKIK